MPGFVRILVFVAPALAILLVAGACSRGGSPAYTLRQGNMMQPTNGMVQSHSGGAVDIDMTWLGVQDNNLSFNVVMDTHSVDLDTYDLGKLAVLRDDAGKEYKPASWKSQPGGHHRTGSLAFLVPDSLSAETATYVEVLIRDVAGVKERSMRWTF